MRNTSACAIIYYHTISCFAVQNVIVVETEAVNLFVRSFYYFLIILDKGSPQCP